jgi:hypothetical protein
MDCPICLETIQGPTNIVVTECGHNFHCSCLMQNVVHNGFGCPYCRTEMAEEEVIDDEYDEYEEYYDDDEDVLRGFRMFNNLLEGIEHDEEDVDYEEYYIKSEAIADYNRSTGHHYNRDGYDDEGYDVYGQDEDGYNRRGGRYQLELEPDEV